MSERKYCDCGCHDLEYHKELCSLCNKNCNLKYTEDEKWKRTDRHFTISFLLFFTAFGSVVFFMMEQGADPMPLYDGLLIMLAISPLPIFVIGINLYRKIQKYRNVQEDAN